MQKSQEKPRAQTCEYSNGKICKITEWNLSECHCKTCASYEEKYIKNRKEENRNGKI